MQGSKFSRTRLLCGAAAMALVIPLSAHAEAANFNIAAQPLTSALKEFGVQSQYTVVAEPDVVATKLSRGVSQSLEPEIALAALLQGTGLGFRREGDTFLIVRADAAPQSGSAAGDGADGTVEALVVTAQKREEDIQDVPIAISAFTQEDLTRSQIAGGPDLMTQVPNFTFTKTNFTGYSIQIRGIGTQAISATTDAAVAVAFNNTPFIRNRFFEQEFYDLERVEVLRGPQGTLYGRNATAGVVNLISSKPKFSYEAKLSADVSNYSSTRLEAMVNIPLVEEKVALRLAGAWTKREGFVTNQITGNPIDGRDLWSTRLSLRVEPTDHISANLIWEHFEENDDRLRSGKQLCHGDNRTEIQGYNILRPDGVTFYGNLFSQGCLPASLYSSESYQAPNGLSLPYYLPLAGIGLPIVRPIGPAGGYFPLDPYASKTQSPDLRVIESTYDPKYRAKTDLAELQLSVDLPHNLTLMSETGYLADALYSIEDYNRFNTSPGAFEQETGRPGLLQDGVFCDPQIGCTSRVVAIDQSTARSRQFSQEFRLSSDYDGDFNFSFGANFMRYDTMEKYYVFINTLTMISAISLNAGLTTPYVGGVTDNSDCLQTGMVPPDFTQPQDISYCTYIDPNPIGSLNDLGHNYFLSKNPYKLISYALFGETYYDLTDTLKLTAGLRWTVDRKEAPRIPSWIIASPTVGYPVYEVVQQEWSEPTGRLTLDWKPDLPFTDETLFYASLSHGYKAGGSNPPPAGIVVYAAPRHFAGLGAIQESAIKPKTFDPEFVNALEIGSKNTLADGRLTLNVGVFYYDYEGYQISQIIDRSAVNYNFDAKIWGAEIEADWRPLENLRLGFKGGYEKTRVADGMKAVDIMDRTAGQDGWIVVRPFPTFASNCILPTAMLYDPNFDALTPRGSYTNGSVGPCEYAYLSDTGFGGILPSDGPNKGQGFDKDLSGNKLPNAPHFTATITGDYTLPLPSDWLVTLHTDLYYQSEAWARIFNTEGYDKLKAYSNINVAAIFSNEDAGWTVMAYIKNVLDRDQITGAFLNSDDTGLTTNVFLNEPRLYGLRVTKAWTDIPWLSNAPKHPAGEPYRLTVELGGQVQRHDAAFSTLTPNFTYEFDPAIDPTTAQHRRLDWGDGREAKVTYRPGRGWAVAAAYRYGRTNSRTTRLHAVILADEKQCGIPPILADFRDQCDPTSPSYTPYVMATATYWSDSSASAREKHEIADFTVGRDFGLGATPGAKSTIGLGLRFADLTSYSDMTATGIPDWQIPDGWALSPSTFHRYQAVIHSEREFKGAGPTLSFDGMFPLLGGDETGRVNIDWSIVGGILFGKQKTEIAGSELAAFYSKPKYTSHGQSTLVEPVEAVPIHIAREKSVTAPVLDLSLGVSYELERFKVGAGYRWERYFDVIDAGFSEHKDYDRTIDGPYVKVSVGFGG